MNRPLAVPYHGVSTPITSASNTRPAISSTIPMRTIRIGAILPLIEPTNPLATNEPIANAISTQPVCSAS